MPQPNQKSKIKNQKSAIVLCGGQSRRMGRPKALLPFGDETLLHRIVRILGEVVDSLVIVAARGQKLPDLPTSAKIVTDEQPDRGPLQGLAAGLAALPENATYAYVSSCDAPFIQPTFVARMFELGNKYQMCVPHIHDRYHPLAAVYHRETLSTIEGLLEQDRLRPAFLFDLVPTRVVGPADLQHCDPQFMSLRNVNTMEEYEAALAQWAD